MILQRKKIQEDIDVVVEVCVQNIRKKGIIDIPSIMIDLEKLSLGNRRYFEENGFCFQPYTLIENGHTRYYAAMKPIYNGTIANSIRAKMLQAQKEYEKEQLEVILRAYEQSVRDFGTDMARVPIDMTKIILDNKFTLEGLGFYFESRNQEGMCWMKKRNGERGS